MAGLILKILLSAFGIVFAALVGFWLGIIRERHNRVENKIIEEKLQVLPKLDTFISKATVYPAPVVVWNESVAILHQHYQRLTILAKGQKLKSLNATWEVLSYKTQKELVGSSKTGVYDANRSEDKEELKSLQQVLIERLESFKNAVEKL